MELTQAKENLCSLVEKYKSKFSEFDIKILADVYLADSKTFANRTDDDPFANVLCASITICSPDAKDENEMCGFDIILNLNKKKAVNDDEFELETSEFKKRLNDFTSKLEDAENINDLIKCEAEKEKEAFSTQMEGYTKKMKKVKIIVTILFAATLISVIFSVFALLLN